MLSRMSENRQIILGLTLAAAFIIAFVIFVA